MIDLIPIPTSNVLLFRREYQVTKRIFDLSLSLLALPLLLPLMGICALLVWLDDPASVLFKQKRTGKGGRRFEMYKFRTMATNAEELKQTYAHLNELTWPDFKITDDPRVTRVGRFLRKTSLDELPQIFNVMKGDMSLVGPRPTSFDMSTYSLWQTERLEVLPGITGLWQVNGRSDLDFNERLRLDIEYIEKQSLWLDIQILISTVTVVFTQRGAY
jgi:exopolysaccharide biosynthesis polyprenyl glycosylphosphotransferase